MQRPSEKVNGISPPDPQELPTRAEWLHRILFSGEVSKLAQHLALAIHFASEEGGILKASLRDLEKLTGWSRVAISEHIADLECVADIVWSSGRAKTSFVLPYVDEAEKHAYIEVITAETKASLRASAIESFGHICSHCQTRGNADAGPDERPWCLDRIIPGKVGGEYVADNVTLSCWACNSRRGADPIEQRIFSLADHRSLQAEWRDVSASVAEVCGGR